MIRKVIWWEYKPIPTGTGASAQNWEKIDRGKATFHQFGVDYEDAGAPFSTAIIELEDGTVKNIPVEKIRFIDGESRNQVMDKQEKCPTCGGMIKFQDNYESGWKNEPDYCEPCNTCLHNNRPEDEPPCRVCKYNQNY